MRRLLSGGKRGLVELQVRTQTRTRSARSSLRRRRLLRTREEVRRVSVDHFQLCGQVVSRYSAETAAAEDLAMVGGLLDEAEIPYFLVPRGHRLRYVVGVEETHRRTLLTLARERFRSTAAYVGVVKGDDTLSAVALWSDGEVPKGVQRSGVLRVGVVRLGPDGQLLHGLDSGCDIEFWRLGASVPPESDDKHGWLTVPGRQLGDVFDESLVAPRRNRVSEVVPPTAREPATLVVGDREFPTFQPFAGDGTDEVRFPIDVVYTWVDGDDPVLAARRSKYREGIDLDIAGREVGPSRYTNHDELKYSLRSLHMYAGFVRHVYLVTDGQVPQWLDTDSDWITVVDHRDVFQAEALPVFNSHAIETRLHHVPGLSDRYLYFNDDVFVNRPVTPEAFFYGNGIAKLPFSPNKLGLGAPHPLEPAPNSAGKNARELIARTFGRTITHKSLHVPHPQLLSVFREISDAGFEEFERTTYSKFRATTDVASVAALHHYWALLSGRGVPGDYKLRYVDVGRADMNQRLSGLERGQDIDFFCLNDVDTDPDVRRRVGAVIRSFLERKFPFQSPAELLPAREGRAVDVVEAIPRQVSTSLRYEIGT